MPKIDISKTSTPSANISSPSVPKLFIIIPIYNVEKYLAECLDSVQAQTYPNFEAVLVDDGSKDNSTQIAQRYAQNNSNFTLLRQENQGVGAARNTALDYIFSKNPAPTDYIGSVDSDDVVAKNYFANLIYCLESQGTLVAKARDMKVFYDDDYDKKIFDATPPKRKGIKRRTNNKNLSSKIEFWRSVYRASLLEHLRFPPVRFAEDRALGVCINALVKDIALTRNALYFYRERTGSLTKTIHQPQEFFNVFRFVYKFFSENDLLYTYKLPIDTLNPRGAHSYLAESSKYLPALQNFIRSLDIAPDVLERNEFLKQALESSDMQNFLRRTEDSKKRFKDYFNIRMTKNKKLIRLFGKTIFDNSRENLPIESKSAESANADSIKANSSAQAINTAKSASTNKSKIFYILRDITESGGASAYASI